MKYEINTYCGLNCTGYEYVKSCNCGGCIATEGKPFHGSCEVAECAKAKGRRFCGECADFPCEILTRYSFDAEHGDNGARIQRCRDIKKALVDEARAGLDPIGYCGHHCDHCFLGEFCGGCRSDYNCCSYATICEGGKCPNMTCAQEKKLDGCWECSELDGCKKGYFSAEDGYTAKSSAQFIRKYGKEKYDAAHRALEAAGKDYPKSIEGEDGVTLLEAYLPKES